MYTYFRAGTRYVEDDLKIVYIMYLRDVYARRAWLDFIKAARCMGEPRIAPRGL